MAFGLRIVEHVGAVGGERQLEERAGEAVPGSTTAKKAARGQVEARFSVRFISRTTSRTNQWSRAASTRRRRARLRVAFVLRTTVPISGSLNRSRGARRRARGTRERPERSPGGENRVRRRRLGLAAGRDRQVATRLLAIERQRDVLDSGSTSSDLGFERAPGVMPARRGGRPTRGELARALRDASLNAARRVPRRRAATRRRACP